MAVSEGRSPSRSPARQPRSRSRDSSGSRSGSSPRSSRDSSPGSVASSGSEHSIQTQSKDKGSEYRIPKLSANPGNFPPPPSVEVETSRPIGPVSVGELKVFQDAARGNGWSFSRLSEFISKIPIPGGSQLGLTPLVDKALRPRHNPRRVEMSLSLMDTVHSASLAVLSEVVTSRALIIAGDTKAAMAHLEATTHLLAGQISGFIYLERGTILRSHGILVRPVTTEIREARLESDSTQTTADGSSRVNLFGSGLIKSIEESTSSAELLSKLKPRGGARRRSRSPARKRHKAAHNREVADKAHTSRGRRQAPRDKKTTGGRAQGKDKPKRKTAN